MKYLFKMFMLILVIIVLSGCAPQYQSEEQYQMEEIYQMCVDTYMESNTIDFTFNVKERYETVEDTYLELIRIAVWAKEKEYEIDDIFYEDNYRWDDTVNRIVNNHNLKRDDLNDLFRKEKYEYKKSLEKYADECLKQVIKESCDEIQNNGDIIFNALSEDGLDYLARAEKERIHKNYKRMFIIICNREIPQEIAYRLYPEEMYQGAMDSIYHPTTDDSVQKARDFLIAIGDYEKYATDIEDASIFVREAERCDYGDCQQKGYNDVKNYDGEFCAAHANYLDNGGRLKKKARPSSNGGGGLDLTTDIEEAYENESNSSNKNNSSKKEENEKKLPYDPYDVYEYDDADDFADEWAEEFDEENYDDGWDDAWDYYWEHHE